MKKVEKTPELPGCLEMVLSDCDLSPAEAFALLAHPGLSTKGMTARNPYVKILGGCSWHTLRPGKFAGKIKSKKEKVIMKDLTSNSLPINSSTLKPIYFFSYLPIYPSIP